MAGPRSRAFVVGLLATVVAIRVSASGQLSGVSARIADDPSAALHHTADGWTVAGTLGDASAQGLRELPLALFYWFGEIAGLRAEVVQASWRVAVLVLAVLGAARLARVVGERRRLAAAQWSEASTGKRIAEPWTTWVAAVVYGCGPVIVSTTARSPLDGLVGAILPWVLVPLVRRQNGWSAAAGSAAWCGLAGVGSPYWAVATLVAGVLAAVPRRRDELRQFIRWLVLAALASSWWIAVWLWEGIHATELTDLVGHALLRDVLGEALDRPTWALPWLVLVVVAPLLVSASALVLRAAGVDRVLVGGLLLAGAIVLTAYGIGGWNPTVLAPSAVDGVPVPLGPVLVWVSLAGLVAWEPLTAHVEALLTQVGQGPLTTDNLVTLGVGGAVVLLSVVGLAVAVQETTRAETRHAELWSKVEAWSEKAPPGRVLVLPATEQPVEPIVARALGRRPWVARDSLPTSGSAATTALDDVVRRLSLGHGGPATAGGLRRLGVAYVLVRGDAPVEVDRLRPAALVRSALRAQGAERVAVMSGVAQTSDDKQPDLIDFGVRSDVPYVEVWAVGQASDGWFYRDTPLSAAGDPAITGDLLDAGVLGARPVQLKALPDKRVDVVSDSARRRSVDQRRALDPYGPILGADEPRELIPHDAAPVTTAVQRLEGATSVRASSSAADLVGQRRRAGSGPSAATDSNVFTAWHSRRGTGLGEWWEVIFPEPVNLAGATAQLVQNAFGGHVLTEVLVETDAGAAEVEVPAGGLISLALPGATKRLRLEASGFTGRTSGTDSFGIAEVSVPAANIRDELVVSGPTTSSWIAAARPGSHANCVPAAAAPVSSSPSVKTATVCDRGLSLEGPDSGSMDRVLLTEQTTPVSGRAWVRAADTDTSAKLADRLARPSVTATASSVASEDLVTRAQAAVDEDASTAWRPGPEDAFPTLTLAWREKSEVSGVRLVLPDEAGLSSVPERVRVAAQVPTRADPAATVTIEAAVDSAGLVAIDPVRTREVTLTFLQDSDVTSVDSTTGGVRPVPIAVAEVEIVGGPNVTYDADTVHRLPCGSGPSVSVDDEEIKTGLAVSARDLVNGSVVEALLCSRPVLAQGENQVRVEASFSWVPLGLVLATPDGELGEVDLPRADPTTTTSFLPTGLLDFTADSRTVHLQPGAPSGTVVLTTPVGKGWTARAGQRDLAAVTVDGWSQGWVAPPGVDEVALTYSAGESLRLAAGVAALGWVAVLLVSLRLSLPRPVRRAAVP